MAGTSYGYFDHEADIGIIGRGETVEQACAAAAEATFAVMVDSAAVRPAHGAGRALSRHQALQQWQGRELVDELARGGILVRTRSLRGAAEEAPGACKDVDLVAEVTERAGLARRVARVRPKICVKG